MARPRKKIDPEQVRKLAEIGCIMSEIGAVVGCSVATLERRFADTVKDGHERRNSSLRRWQYESASKGNTAMLIWLGKQHLGQKDKQELSGDQNAPVAQSITVKFVDGNG